MAIQNRNLVGAGEAIERSKDALERTASEAGETARETMSDAAESAQEMYDEARDALTRFSNETYDFVGDTFRAGEDYARRKPMQALAIATLTGAVIGFCFAVRAAPRASGRLFDRY